MKRIVRGLFHEKEKIHEDKTSDFFDEDSLFKIVKLMQQYSIDENVVWKNRTVRTIPNFLDRLSYQLPHNSLKDHYDLSQLISLFNKSSKINDFLSTIELFANTLCEECADLGQSYPHFYLFVDEFNNLLALKTIPFRMEIGKNKIFIDRINSSKEEENKRNIYQIIDSSDFLEVNEHFTNSLIKFSKKGYPESVEEAYLTLEKYLKIKINNHKFDALKSYAEFTKLFEIERGIFKIYKDKIKNKISFVYAIRSEIKSHSNKNIFNRKDFLEETSRFQINEVMNLIILLDSFNEK